MDAGVSVLMPVHNGGQYLQAAVDSILSQTYSQLELIIVDDHSSDSAIEQLSADSRLKVVSSPVRGIVAALNHGIEMAKFEFIARMDGDDVAMPDRLATQLNYLKQHPDVDICGAQVQLFKDEGEIGGGYRHYQDWINRQCTPGAINRNFFVESCIPHPTAVMHRHVLEKLGGYHDTSWPEDYDLWCRAHVEGYRFGKPENKILLRWRDHQERASRNESRYEKQQFLQCKAHYLSHVLKAREIEQCMIWGAGPTGAKMHDYMQQNGIEVTGFVDINPKMENAQKRGKPVHLVSIEPTAMELSGVKPISVVSVSARGARERIRSALLKAGLQELQDFILAA